MKAEESFARKRGGLLLTSFTSTATVAVAVSLMGVPESTAWTIIS
jgi:hypothetical protein